MIVSKIVGGLGNQMFQYAVARSLSVQREHNFKIDITRYSAYNLHQGFELNRVFGDIATIAKEEDIKKILGWQASPLANRYLAHRYFSRFRSCKFIQEPSLDYWPGIMTAPKSCYLSGYWQSEYYFKKIESIIRKDFSFHLPLSVENQKTADHITKGNSISLHVRRGDYVSNPSANSHHGTCSLAYYETAIKYLSDRISDPVFFVFSDDIDWVKSNLDIPHSVFFIEHNKGSNSYCDMQLMSLCSHHIIANSSFSWWGAWLGNNQNKIVITPQQWFAQSSTPSGLIPESWVRL